MRVVGGRRDEDCEERRCPERCCDERDELEPLRDDEERDDPPSRCVEREDEERDDPPSRCIEREDEERDEEVRDEDSDDERPEVECERVPRRVDSPEVTARLPRSSLSDRIRREVIQ